MTVSSIVLAEGGKYDSVSPLGVGLLVLGILVGLLAITVLLGAGRPHE